MYLGSLLLRERREEEERDRAEEGTGGREKGERVGEREGPGREGEEREGEGRAPATLWHGAPQCLNPALIHLVVVNLRSLHNDNMNVASFFSDYKMLTCVVACCCYIDLVRCRASDHNDIVT